MIRTRYLFNGQIQGVGFRPFLYRLAVQRGLSGFVRNTSQGVILEVQGESLDGFLDLIKTSLPPLARIDACFGEEAPLVPAEQGFVILPTLDQAHGRALIGPDMATCPACLAELTDPANRRYRYPFTNCTDCGPRYTITARLPYDRTQTSMGCFPMCRQCQAEYDDPLDRRFHAQPNACPVCGPRLWLCDRTGRVLGRDQVAVQLAAEALSGGQIVAIKGLGGFHLSCSALDDQAVAELRRRKGRSGKALAVMAADMATARRLAAPDDYEAGLLLSPARPIVLLAKKDRSGLSGLLAPDTDRVGLMLPYTPLHQVLFLTLRDLSGPAALVMTSGNRSGLPLAIGNRQALAELGPLADLFLLHDRDIVARADDSVLMRHPLREEVVFVRRSRGYAPVPLSLSPDLANHGPDILALGAELKNTVCFLSGQQAFVSPHIGDLGDAAVMDFQRQSVDHLAGLFNLKAGRLARDLHPDYASSLVADELAASVGLEVIAVPHHLAHAAALLAEHNHDRPALVLTLDGTGFGPDGTTWGGELLQVDLAGAQWSRLAGLKALPMPGADLATLEPWRMSQACLHLLGIHEPSPGRPWPWLAGYAQASQVVARMLEKNMNCPLSSGCGRLFDAVSAMLGLGLTVAYEAQAAIRLEAAQDMSERRPYDLPYELGSGGRYVLDSLALFRQVYEDWLRQESVAIISRRFHLGLANGLAGLAGHLASATGLADIGLSGGVMLNQTMIRELNLALRKHGLNVLEHIHLPPSDACLSFGQSIWAARAEAIKSNSGAS